MADREVSVRFTGEQTVARPAQEVRVELERLSRALDYLNQRSAAGVSDLGPAIADIQSRLRVLGTEMNAVAAATDGLVARSRTSWAAIGAEIDRTRRAGERYVASMSAVRPPSIIGQISTRELDQVGNALLRARAQAVEVERGIGVAFTNAGAVARREMDAVRRSIERAYSLPPPPPGGGPPPRPPFGGEPPSGPPPEDPYGALTRAGTYGGRGFDVISPATRQAAEDASDSLSMGINEGLTRGSRQIRADIEAAFRYGATATQAAVNRAVVEQNRAQVERVQEAAQRTAGAAAVTWREGAFRYTQAEVERMFGPERDAERRAGRLGGRGRRGAPIDFEGMFGGMNRIGALEMQAAVINTVQALAAGITNPAQVAMMMAPQFAGAAVQGGLISLGTIFSAMTSPIGLAVAGLTALGGTLAVVAYSARQADATFARIGYTAAAQGRPPGIAEENARAWAEQISMTGLGRVASRTGGDVAATIPNISLEAREAIASGFGGVARQFFGEDAEEAAKFLRDKFGSPGQMKGLVDELNLVQGEAKKTFEAAVEIGDGFTASTIAAEALRDRVKGTTDNMRAARQEQGWLGRTFDITGIERENILRRLGGGGRSVLSEPRFPAGTLAPTEPEIKANRAAEDQLRIETQINGLLMQRRQILAGLQVSGITDEKRAEYEQALRENERRLAETHTPLVREGHQAKMAALDAEIAKAEQAAQRDDSAHQRVIALKQQRVEALAAFEMGALARVEGATRQKTAAELAAIQQVADARRAAAVAELERSVFEVRYQAAQAPTDPRAQLAAARRELSLLDASEVSQKRQIEQLLIQIVGLEKQVADYTRDAISATIQQREVLAQARGELAAIVDLKRQERALVYGDPHKSQADRVRADTAVMQSQISAQRQAIQLQQQGVAAANSFAQQRLQTSVALLNLEVLHYNATREQALQAEANLTAEVMAQQQQRLAGLLQLQGLQPEQRAQINNELASLYEQDAQKQIEIHTRLTEEIRRENEKRTQYFKNFFQSVEQGAADLLIAGVTRSQTRTEALRSFARSITTSFINEMTKMGSQFVGKGLADVLGVKIDPSGDTSISSVLAKAVGGALGLTKAEPKLDQAAIAGKMNLAAEAHQKAAAELSAAAAKLSQTAGEAPYRGGVNPELSSSELGTSRVQPREAPAMSRAGDYGATGEYGVGQPVRSSTEKAQAGPGVYGVPGAVMNYGRSGALGSVEEAARNLVTIQAQSGATFRVHQQAAEAFKGFIADLEAGGYRIDPSQSGGYVKREMRGGSGYSEHAFGTAIDINWERNPFRTSATDLPANIGDIAAKHGLIWGGRWTSPRDPMHFQWGGPNAGMPAMRPEPIAEVPSFDGLQSLDPAAIRLGNSFDSLQQRIDSQPAQKIYQGLATSAASPDPLTSTPWASQLYAMTAVNTLPFRRGLDWMETMVEGFSDLGQYSVHGLTPGQNISDESISALISAATLRPGMNPGTLSSLGAGPARGSMHEWQTAAARAMRLEAEQQISLPFKEPIKLDLKFEPLTMAPAETAALTRTATDIQTATQSLSQTRSMFPVPLTVPDVATVTQAATQMAVQTAAQTAAQTSTLVSGLAAPASAVDLGVDLSTLTTPATQTATSTEATAQATQQIAQSIQNFQPAGGQPPSIGGPPSSVPFDYAGPGSWQGPQLPIPPSFNMPSARYTFFDGKIWLSGDYVPHGELAARGAPPSWFDSNIAGFFNNNLGPRGGLWNTTNPELDTNLQDAGIELKGAAASLKDASGNLKSGGIGSDRTLGGTSNISSNVASLGSTFRGLTQVTSLATGAMSLFGFGLSETGRKIFGAVSLITQAISLFGSMSSGGGGIFGTILGGAVKLFTGGIFERGGIVPSGFGGMIIPSAADGMVVDGRGGQLGIFHPQEMVLPADISTSLQRFLSRGDYAPPSSGGRIDNNAPVFNYNANVTGYHPFQTRSSFEALLRQHGASARDWFESQLRNSGVFGR